MGHTADDWTVDGDLTVAGAAAVTGALDVGSRLETTK